MKKLIALLLALVMVLGMVACAAKTETPAAEEPKSDSTPAVTETPSAEEPADETAEKPYEGVKLKFWTAPFVSDDKDLAYWNSQMEKFHELTGAEVEVEIVGWTDMAAKYLTGFMADEAADLMYMTNEIAYEFIEQGLLLDVSPYWSEEDVENENFWEQFAYGDAHYLVPYAGGSGYRGLCYNMEILNECGVTELPTTWEEFLDVCEAVKTGRPDVYVYMSYQMGNVSVAINNFVVLLNQAGGSLVNEDNTAYTINTPEGLEAMNYIKTLADNGYISADCLGIDDPAARDLFAEGKAAIFYDGVKFIAGYDIDFEWEASTAMCNERAAVNNAIDSLSVNANSENKDAAIALLKFLRSPDSQAEIFEQLSASAQLCKDWPVAEYDSHVMPLFDNPERAFFTPVAPGINNVLESIMTAQQLVVMGELSPEDALAQIQAEADKAF